MKTQKTNARNRQCEECIFLLDCHPKYFENKTVNKTRYCPLAPKNEKNSEKHSTPQENTQKEKL